MEYFIAFLEGIITFVSPCLLPMLPVYVSYFAGGKSRRTQQVAVNAVGFILGFTTVFLAMGALASTVGTLLTTYRTVVNIVTGGIVIMFGLHFLGLFHMGIFKGIPKTDIKPLGFFSAFLFGLVFSVGWTPCVGAFLGSALMLAANQDSIFRGIGMLLCYSLGLGIPFFISAVLIEKLKGVFGFIKNHYRIINTVSGVLLILLGVCMATGWLTTLLS